MEEVAGYVCNNTKCKKHGWAKYIEDEGSLEAPCPSCKEDRTMLPKPSKHVKGPEKGPDITAPAVKLHNGKYYG